MSEQNLSEIYIKEVELADGRKAVLKTEWNEGEVNIAIFIDSSDSPEVYVGSCKQESLRNNKINVDYAAIKESLTSKANIDSIFYELNQKRMKFEVVALEAGDSEDSTDGVVYLATTVKKLDPNEVISLAIQLLRDVSKLLTLKSALDLCNAEKEMLASQFELLRAEKSKFDDEVYQNFLELLNSKKRQIAKLEQRQSKALNTTNKFLNLSSDFDQSDLSAREAAPSSQDSILEATTSKTPTSKRHFKPNSPAGKASPRRTPRKTKSTPPRKLFDFAKETDSDDSMYDDPLSPKKKLRSTRAEKVDLSCEKIFENLSVKVTPKKGSDNENIADLYTSKPNARKRLSSSTSEASKKSRELSKTPEFEHLAQKLDYGEEPEKEKHKSSEEAFKSCDDVFTQNVMTMDEDDEIQSSQPSADSPSIFGTFNARKVKASPKAAKRESKRSKFSIDTIDILGDVSP